MHNTKASQPAQTTHIETDQAGLRLDRYLVALLDNISRTAAQQLVTEGAILVNGKPSKAGYALRQGDEIQVFWTAPASLQREVIPRQLPLDVLYEDDDLLIINKAAGIVVHPAPGHHDDTLVNALVARYPELQSQEGNLRPGIVHRLDRDTSGLLIVARNIHTQTALIEQMKRQEIEKRYLALVEGVIDLDQGSIEAPIGRDPRNRQQMAITVTGSREARTYFRVLRRYAHHTLLLLQLATGRTHQIRVHLQAIGHHVVGDPVYGSGHSRKGLHVPRQFLHAYQLRFPHPTSGKLVEFEAPLPTDLQAVLDQESVL
ncbi:MAG TPA: RluA family pseudouridine synthase [Ktedonobacteraceae bacterium]|jgi:23S rRNA pseudouridine1911/1915/1917 synthase